MSAKRTNKSKEIDLLRAELQKTIQDCEFAKARQLDARIKHLQQQTDNFDAERHKNENQIEFEIEKEIVRKKALEQYSIAFQNVCRIKTQFQVRLSDLQQIHATQLSEHAQQYARDLELALNRNCSEADALVKEAQINARAGNFDVAESLYEEQTSIRNEFTQAKQNEVHTQAKQARDRLKQKQTDELYLCRQKLQSALEELLHSYETEIEKLQRRLQTAALKLKVDFNPEQAESYFQQLAIDDDSLFPPTPVKSRPSSRGNSRSVKSSKSPSKRSTPPRSRQSSSNGSTSP